MKSAIAYVAKKVVLRENIPMKIFALFLLLTPLVSFQAWSALSYGDASDGDCYWNSTQELPKNTWNCQDIYVAPGAEITFAGSDVVTLMAQGSVIIEGTIDVSADVIDDEPTPGPGGEGPGTSGGPGGDAPADESGGGGGGAGHAEHGGNGLGSDDDSFSGGEGGMSYGNENNFHLAINGGKGGGAGGFGNNGAVAPGQGGAGGGAIVIVAKGTIIVNSFIDASGGQGQPGDADFDTGAGGGGGGSGGSIYLISAREIEIEGALNFDGGDGGVGGAGLSNGGEGGKGSRGRVRLDAPSVIGSAVPVGDAVINHSLPSGIFDPLEVSIPNLHSDIEYACSYNEIAPLWPNLGALILGFFLIAFPVSMARQFSKVR